MNGLREELLTGPGFAPEHDGRGRVRGQTGDFHGLQYLVVRPHDVGKTVTGAVTQIALHGSGVGPSD